MSAVHPLAVLARAVVRSPALLRVRPSVSAFLVGYLRKFPAIEIGGRVVLHSHLPALDSPAYARFVRLHLVDRVAAPSHAQIAVTNACPQRCPVCYNRDRAGTPLTPAELRSAIDQLVSCGVVWLGLTGGEPLLRRDLTDLVAIGRGRAALKLFTTGMGATPALAAELRDAGLSSVSVSIDHWDEATNDRGRGLAGAWRAAVDATEMFLTAGGLHVGISAVLPRDLMRGVSEIERLLSFAGTLGVHELWLSEVKPTVASLWQEDAIVTDTERRAVAAFQDGWNGRTSAERRGVTLNYLGHFEGAEHFGCNAGQKMVYVDAFGNVSPCVFTPVSFGNLREQSIAAILASMRSRFPTESCCFINRNWGLVAEVSRGALPLGRDQTLALLERVRFGPLSAFNRRYFGRHR